MHTIYMYVNFVAVWIIVAAKKDEAMPDNEIGRAVHYNGGSSRMYCQGPHTDQFQAMES